MEAHLQLLQRGYNVSSYGTGTFMRLPLDRSGGQKTFEMDNATYQQALDWMKQQDEKLRNFFIGDGIMKMMERNVKIKAGPQRWQNLETLHGRFDVVICLDDRVYEAVLEDISSRELEDVDELKPMHIIFIEIGDNAVDSVIGGQIVAKLAEKLEKSPREDDVETIAKLVDEIARDHPQKAVLLQTVYV
jgi:RNA polymerase II subunit A C-terminal domain phosphatase SSU72